jgi:secreted trypsin-like serine protease
MRGRPAVIATVAVLVLAFATPASAITDGKPDSAHPYVGLVGTINTSTGARSLCTGSLIAENVVLTAGHCTHGYDIAFVWFGESVDPQPAAGVFGIPLAHPGYDRRTLLRDVGVVLLSGPTGVSGTATLPATAGVVDELRNKTKLTVVGYGVQGQLRVPGKYLKPYFLPKKGQPKPPPPPYWRWDTSFPLERMRAPSELVSGKFKGSADDLRNSLNASRGKGGTCFGDSGGPVLLGGTDMVLGVTSWGNNVNCEGVGYSQRVDIQDVLDWIGGYLP